MKTIIETERLRLREFCLADAEACFKLNTDLEVLKYTGDEPFESIEDATLFLSNYNEYQENGYGRWAVIEKTSKAFIGWCGLKRHSKSFTDLGFRFFRKDWGKGYGTEAAKAALKVGFEDLKLDEIIGRAAIDNKASVKILEKIGMAYWKKDTCKSIDNAVYYKIDQVQFNAIKLK